MARNSRTSLQLEPSDMVALSQQAAERGLPARTIMSKMLGIGNVSEYIRRIARGELRVVTPEEYASLHSLTEEAQA